MSLPRSSADRAITVDAASGDHSPIDFNPLLGPDQGDAVGFPGRDPSQHGMQSVRNLPAPAVAVAAAPPAGRRRSGPRTSVAILTSGRARRNST